MLATLRGPARARVRSTREDLMDVDPAGAERDRGGGEVGDPGSENPLPHDRPRLVGTPLQPREPCGGRLRVVAAKRLDVEDPEARVLHARDRMADASELRSREDLLEKERHPGGV